MWVFFIFIALEYTVGISLIGNSPCKIASEILCLSESSSSQQPVKAAGPPASPGAASAAYCQPDLVVKMVKPPQRLPLRKLSCFPAAFPCCQPGPKAPSCRQSAREVRGAFEAWEKMQPRYLLELFGKTQRCLGLAELYFGQNEASRSPVPGGNP